MALEVMLTKRLGFTTITKHQPIEKGKGRDKKKTLINGYNAL
jgi:hypothetical protein